MAEFANVVVTPEELQDGFSAEEIFCNPECQGITFDDLISLPGSIDFNVGEVELETRVTRNFKISHPLCSTPMASVTEHEMAIGMALHGCIGFIHCDCSAEEQISMVEKVKNFENGFILDPVVLSPDDIIMDLDALRHDRKISGVPVTIDGRMGSKLVGLISNRDTDFIEDRTKKVAELMTPIEKLVTGRHPISIVEANNILKESKKGYLPIIDEDGNLKALTTRTDLKKNRDFPLSSKDKNGTLLVGAAVKASTRDVMDTARVMDLYEAGCNIIVLDAQNGDCDVQVEYIKWIKRNCPGMDVVAGNVVRTSQAKPLLEAGADALRIGMGVGSVATTQLVKAVGRAQLSSIFTVSRFAAKYGVPVIADGGIKNTGCIIKALSIGASCVMMGSLLAGVKESPGEYFFQNGIRLKKYRGNYSAKFTTEGPSEIQMSPKMRGKGFGSPKKANTKSYPSNTVARVASGVDGAVPDNGPLRRYIPYLCQSIRHGFQDQGARSMTQVHDFLRSGELRFELRSPSAQKEGGVHDLHSFSQRLYA